MRLPALLAAVLVAAPAAAQSPEDDEGRRRFREGVELAGQGRWAAAEAAFEDAWEALGEPRVLLNLAGARVATGALRAGAHTYAHFLARCDDAALCDVARTALSDVERRLPRLRIALEGLRPGDLMSLDGRMLSLDAIGVELPLDPGPHRLAVRRGARIHHFDATLEESERLVLTGVVADEVSDAGASSRWVTIGLVAGAVAVAAAAVVIGVVLARAGDDPFRGSLPPGSVRTP